MQNFHNVPPRPHGHGQHPVNQPVPVYGHQIEPGQVPPSMQGGPQPAAPPPYGGVISYPSPVSVPNGQAGMNFGGQHVQNIVKEPFQNTMDPSMLPQPPPGVQGGQYTNDEYSKFGIGHLYSGKIVSDMSSGVGLGMQGMQTMLLPSNAQMDGSGRQQVRPTLVPLMNPTTENILGIHISQLGGLNAAQVEGEASGGSIAPGLGGKMPPGGATNMEAFALHHRLTVEGPNLHASGLGRGTMVTPSTSNIVMAPAVFSATASENNLPAFNSARGGGVAGGVVPIGSERAQKATLSALPGKKDFSVLTQILSISVLFIRVYA